MDAPLGAGGRVELIDRGGKILVVRHSFVGDADVAAAQQAARLWCHVDGFITLVILARSRNSSHRQRSIARQPKSVFRPTEEWPRSRPRADCRRKAEHRFKHNEART